jgi:hypothetical protein
VRFASVTLSRSSGAVSGSSRKRAHRAVASFVGSRGLSDAWRMRCPLTYPTSKV